MCALVKYLLRRCTECSVPPFLPVHTGKTRQATQQDEEDTCTSINCRAKSDHPIRQVDTRENEWGSDNILLFAPGFPLPGTPLPRPP